jgi:hypothetical protein
MRAVQCTTPELHAGVAPSAGSEKRNVPDADRRPLKEPERANALPSVYANFRWTIRTPFHTPGCAVAEERATALPADLFADHV